MQTRGYAQADPNQLFAPGRMTGISLGAITFLMYLAAPHAQAGRPLSTDDAGTVAPGTYEWEAGVKWHRDGGADGWEFPFGVTTGLTPDLELGVGFGSRIQESEEAAGTSSISGVGDLAMGVKWNILTEADSFASHALTAAVKFPTASQKNGLGTGETDFDLTYIASKSLTEQWSAHLNVGYTWTGNPPDAREDDLVHAGIALGWQVSPSVELLSEVVGVLPESGHEEAAAECFIGARWHVGGQLTLDAALGTSVLGDATDVSATLGLTWLWEPGSRQ